MAEKCDKCDGEWHAGYAQADEEAQSEYKSMQAENDRLNEEVDRLKALLDEVVDIAKGA